MAVARAWGLPVGAAVGVVLGVAAVAVGDVLVDLPTVQEQVRVLHVVPGIAGVVLPFVLVDRTPELTLLSARRDATLRLLRLAAVVVTATPVVVGLVAAGWSLPAGLVVLGLLGIAACACGGLGAWYWVPMMVVLVGWTQWGQRDEVFRAGASWLAVDLALLAVGGGLYVTAAAGREVLHSAARPR